MLETLNITKALSDENRVRALMMLTGGELCVCQIIEMLGLAPSTVSKHMSILRQANLVESRKQGRWMHYSISGKDAPADVKKAINWLTAGLKKDPKIQKDKKNLLKLLKVDKEELCRKQRS
jgi:DNA-binding transcriptional ArsR family regulator